jgi:hypothetical protein
VDRFRITQKLDREESDVLLIFQEHLPIMPVVVVVENTT